MFVPSVPFVLFLTGSIAGAIAWVVARHLRRTRDRPPIAAALPLLADPGAANVSPYPHPPTAGSESTGATASHPAGRSRRDRKADQLKVTLPIGPDDDPEFLRELARRINGTDDGTAG